MERVIYIVFDKILSFFIKVIGTILSLTIILQIFSRIIMIHPFTWTEELSRFSFIWFCFLGSAYALHKKLHMGIDYFYRQYRPEKQRKIEIFVQLIILLFGALLIYYGIVLVQLTSIQLSTILRIPMSYMFSVLPITGTFFCLASVNQILSSRKQRRD
jgi:TRAP-type C4-dicarboxylate transport system permease small subunit